MAIPAEQDDVSPRRGDVDPLVRLVGPDMARVNRMILDRAVSDVEMIPDVARHLIDSGGKRLRPMITCATARLCGYDVDNGDAHVTLAAAVEFMHTATLLHDDVVDESEMRRGKPAARMIWGNQGSVLVGDFLLGEAFKMMVDVGSLDALRVLSDTAAVISEGEVMQLVTARNTATTEADYYRVIGAKTAALFAAAAEVGGIVAGVDGDVRKNLSRFGHAIGMAFQLADDALDYAGEQEALGKRVGDDFRERKVTLPMILALAAGDADERAFWDRTIRDGDQREGDLEHALDLVARHKTIPIVLARAEQFAADAVASLSDHGDATTRDALTDAAWFSVSRDH